MKLLLFMAVFCYGIKIVSATFHDLIQVGPSSEGDECIARRYTNSQGEKYIVKQAKTSDFRPLVVSYVASIMGQKIGIPIGYSVFLAPSPEGMSLELPLKPILVEKHVPGKPCSEEDEEFRIQQRSRSPETKEEMDQKYGEIPESRKGLSEKVIRTMSQHPDLPKIVAFDTFINNADRSPPNLFYDSSEDRYWGIDQGAAFENKNLAGTALKQLKNMPHFVEKQRKCLIVYKETLELLYEQFPPDTVYSLLINALGKLSIKEDDALWATQLERWKTRLENNYQSTKELIDFLEAILK